MRHAGAGVMIELAIHDIARIDMSARYALSADVPLIVRAPDELQIGVEEPRRVLLLNAPPEATGILSALDGLAPVGSVLTTHDADPVVWSALLGELLVAGLLVKVGPVPPGPGPGSGPGSGHLSGERIGLAHRHGQVAATRILQARQDALVVVRGDSAAASLVAALVAAAGVGHVHHDPSRSRPVMSVPDDARRAAATASNALRAVNPFVRTHQPAGHQSPTLVVLADDPVPDLGLAATLVQQRIAHLSVLTQAARALVGPLVLPGRSSCLGCANRHRADADPGWPMVARQLSRQTPRAPVAISAMAACFASVQVLEMLDGASVPATVNGSVEWTPDGLSARRRTWPEHPDCGCRAFG
ncbi:MAG TPA: hypothetical protein VIU11_28770 [Nakamurella sp.]